MREARGISQTELAKATGLSQGLVSKYESNQRLPSSEHISLISDSLDAPESFFAKDDLVLGTGVGEIFHRRRNLPSKQLAQIHAKMNIRTFAIRKLLAAVEFPPVDLPTYDLDEEPSIESLTEALRQRWYVPPGPIRSVTALLHRAGILIVPFDFDTVPIDAIGQWTTDLPPMIFVSNSIPQDRLRFTLMHEVAHFCLHQRSQLREVTPDIEHEANLFASAFLLPATTIRPRLRGLSIRKLVDLKREWRVAMSAILMRARQLEVISERAARDLWMQMGRLGYRKVEPQEVAVEGEDPDRRYRELLSLYLDDLEFGVDEIGSLVDLHDRDTREWILLCPGHQSLRAL